MPFYLASEYRPSWPPSRLAIRRTHTAAIIGEGTDSTRPVTLYFFDRRRGMGHFMQLELGQFDIVDVPDLGIQLLASGWIERLFRLFQQLVDTGVLPAGQHLGVLALGVQVAPEKVIRVKAIRVAIDQSGKVALLAGLVEGHGVERLQFHLEANAGPLLLDDLANLAGSSGGGVQDDLERGTYGACLLEQGFRFVGVVLQAADPFQVPRVATR